MKKALIAVSAAAAAVVAAACSSGGGSSGPPGLASGTYINSKTTIAGNCQVTAPTAIPAADGQIPFTVTVAGTQVSIGGWFAGQTVTLTRPANSNSMSNVSFTGNCDFTVGGAANGCTANPIATSYNCKATVTQAQYGFVTASNVFNFQGVNNFTNIVGTQCPVALSTALGYSKAFLTVPCDDDLEATFTKQ